MSGKWSVNFIFQTCYIINTSKIQSSKIRQISLRWIQTSSRKEPINDKVPGWGKSLWNKIFGKYLLTTNILSSGILMAAGDVLSQELEFRNGTSSERWDWFRMGRMFIVGSLQGPPHHYFYKWLDEAMPTATMKTTISKILLDQTVMSPIDIVIFFYPACFLEGRSLQEANEEVRNKFVTVLMADWMIWPMVQFVNFHYLHPKYRVIFLNVITTLYNIFLSYVKHQHTSNQEPSQ